MGKIMSGAKKRKKQKKTVRDNGDFSVRETGEISGKDGYDRGTLRG